MTARMAHAVAVRMSAAFPRRPAKSPRSKRRVASSMEAPMYTVGSSEVGQPNQKTAIVM
jgi:hypothetical protein